MSRFHSLIRLRFINCHCRQRGHKISCSIYLVIDDLPVRLSLDDVSIEKFRVRDEDLSPDFYHQALCIVENVYHFPNIPFYMTHVLWSLSSLSNLAKASAVRNERQPTGKETKEKKNHPNVASFFREIQLAKALANISLLFPNRTTTNCSGYKKYWHNFPNCLLFSTTFF